MATTKTAKAEEAEVPVEIKADLRRFNKAEEQVTKAVAALAAIGKIENTEQLDSAMLTLSNSAKVEKLIEAKRVEMVKPFNDEVKKINGYAKELTAKLPPAIATAKNVVIAYNKEQRIKLENKRKELRGAQLEGLGFKVNVTGTGYIYEDIVIPVTAIAEAEDDQWIIAYNNNAQLVSYRKEAALKALEETSSLNDAFGTDADKQEIADKMEELKVPVQAQPTYAPSFSTGSVTSVKGITKTWTHSIVNESLIPREYLVVDSSKITKAIREGVREIPGVSIFQKEGLTVRS